MGTDEQGGGERTDEDETELVPLLRLAFVGCIRDIELIQFVALVLVLLIGCSLFFVVSQNLFQTVSVGEGGPVVQRVDYPAYCTRYYGQRSEQTEFC